MRFWGEPLELIANSLRSGLVPSSGKVKPRCETPGPYREGEGDLPGSIRWSQQQVSKCCMALAVAFATCLKKGRRPVQTPIISIRQKRGSPDPVIGPGLRNGGCVVSPCLGDRWPSASGSGLLDLARGIRPAAGVFGRRTPTCAI
jgi:hypothetical protein